MGRIVILALLVLTLGVWAWVALQGGEEPPGGDPGTAAPSEAREPSAEGSPERVARLSPAGAPGGEPVAADPSRGPSASSAAGSAAAGPEGALPESGAPRSQLEGTAPPGGGREVAAVARGAGGAAGPAADPDATPGDASAEPDVLGFAEDADRFDDPPLDPEFDPTAPAREIAAAREQEEKFRRIAELDPDRRRDILVLREILESDPDYEVRIEAAEQLAFSVRRAAVNALKGGLDDGDPRVVAAVIEGIEFTGGTADTAALVPLLNDPDPEVRRLAAEAIEFLE